MHKPSCYFSTTICWVSDETVPHWSCSPPSLPLWDWCHITEEDSPYCNPICNQSRHLFCMNYYEEVFVCGWARHQPLWCLANHGVRFPDSSNHHWTETLFNYENTASELCTMWHLKSSRRLQNTPVTYVGGHSSEDEGTYWRMVHTQIISLQN